jgi:cytidylate kinase
MDDVKIKITISGPAKCGKSTIARYLANELNCVGDVTVADDVPTMKNLDLTAQLESLRDKVKFEIEVLNG